uniref:Secreted protein n=1 Tax=Heterorhabditis bacteriophora TaxID=37862 RepID=A0A1I7XMM1_HETBA
MDRVSYVCWPIKLLCFYALRLSFCTRHKVSLNVCEGISLPVSERLSSPSLFKHNQLLWMEIVAEISTGRVWQEIRRVRERLSAAERNRSCASTPTTYDLHHKAIIASCECY